VKNKYCIKNIARLKLSKSIRGASMIEYIVGLSALVLALIVPNPAFQDDSGNNISAVQLLELALKKEYASYSNSISNPR